MSRLEVTEKVITAKVGNDRHAVSFGVGLALQVHAKVDVGQVPALQDLLNAHGCGTQDRVNALCEDIA